MKLTFEINDELDLANEVPSALNNISTLVLALPHLQKATNMNSDVMINAGYFLSGVIDDIAEAVSQYVEKKANREKRGDKEMILFTPKDDSKEGFNKLLMERVGGADNLTHKAIYDVAYELYYSLACVTDKKEALSVMVGALNDELKELRLQLKEAKDEKNDLVEEHHRVCDKLYEFELQRMSETERAECEEMEKLLQGD